MTLDTQCPYCIKTFEIEHEGDVQEDEFYRAECPRCNKTYIYCIHISFSAEEEKADCLNDGEHDYKPTTTFPKFMTRMRCSMCFDERKPTLEERVKYNIPTKD